MPAASDQSRCVYVCTSVWRPSIRSQIKRPCEPRLWRALSTSRLISTKSSRAAVKCVPCLCVRHKHERVLCQHPPKHIAHYIVRWARLYGPSGVQYVYRNDRTIVRSYDQKLANACIHLAGRGHVPDLYRSCHRRSKSRWNMAYWRTRRRDICVELVSPGAQLSGPG